MAAKTFFIILILIICTSDFASSCTIFNAARSNKILVGNNEDWLRRDSYIKFLPAGQRTYGTVLFGFGKGCKYPFGGVNDQGLFYDIASLTRREDIVFDPNKDTYDNPIYERMLEKCRSVDEAIEFLRKYNISGFRRHHIMIVDKTGTSAILEWGKDALSVVRKQGHYQVMTNFNITDPNLAGWYPCRRYSRADNVLRNMDELSVDIFRALLDRVHIEGRYQTVYSNIYDLKNGAIYIYHFHNFEEHVKIGITDELQKGEHSYYLPSLFSDVKLLSPSESEEVNTTSVDLVWQAAADSYKLFCSTDPKFTKCEPISVTASQSSLDYLMCFTLASGSVFIAFGLWKRKERVLFASLVLLTAFLLVSCEKEPDKNPSKVIRKTVANLQNNTTYYWKLVALRADGFSSESIIRSFHVRIRSL